MHTVNPKDLHTAHPKDARTVNPKDIHTVNPRDVHTVNPRDIHTVNPRDIHTVNPRDIHTVNLQEKFSLFSDHWKQRVIGDLNDSQVKIVKIKGEFVWHHHDKEDELFLVTNGTLRMKFRDHEERIGPGEFIIVPRGVEHCPVADEEVHMVLIEPKTTLNTGNIVNERTVADLERI